ncbi:MAG: hypothetical protein DSM106950_26345 [Stigonema ocellatum SAG 48.90 = DSM 106950]|nr:hypothetical protein [Stigonema ocellatum SAG 48.90 = DSM 106950]
MPGFILDVGSTIQCIHAGQAKPIISNPRVKIEGRRILTQVCICRITGCSNPPPPAGLGPCVTTAPWITTAARVTASGMPVLLRDSQTLCIPTGTNILIQSTQTRVKGM